jgi:hypothetical protein
MRRSASLTAARRRGPGAPPPPAPRAAAAAVMRQEARVRPADGLPPVVVPTYLTEVLAAFTRMLRGAPSSAR